jgi:hypothetical protein
MKHPPIFILSLIITICSIALVNGQKYSEIKKKYEPYEIITLSYGNVIEIKNLLASNKLTGQINQLVASTSVKKAPLENSLGEFKAFITLNAGTSHNDGLSYMNFHLKDTIILYKRADDYNLISIKAGVHPNEIYYWVFFVDRYKKSALNVQNSTDNMVTDNVGDSYHNIQSIAKESLNDLKEFEQDPFVSQEMLGSYRFKLTGFVYSHKEEIERLKYSSPEEYQTAQTLMTKFEEIFNNHPKNFEEPRQNIQYQPEVLERLNREEKIIDPIELKKLLDRYDESNPNVHTKKELFTPITPSISVDTVSIKKMKPMFKPKLNDF